MHGLYIFIVYSVQYCIFCFGKTKTGITQSASKKGTDFTGVFLRRALLFSLILITLKS